MCDASIDSAGRDKTMFAANVLLAYANHNVLTQTLNRAELIALKGHVIRLLQEEIVGSQATDLSTISAVMALSTWVAHFETAPPSGDTSPRTSNAGSETLSDLEEAASPMEMAATAHHVVHRSAALSLIKQRGGAETMLQSSLGRTTLTYLIL